MPAGWMEWDWFDGAVLANAKDFESVTLITENVSATCPVAVYWKDDDSTAWELLGTNTTNNATLRWSDYLTRPNTKRFKLGLQMTTTDITSTPRIRAIVVRFLTNVADRYGWNVAIQVNADTPYLNGEEQALTVAQLCAHLDALEVQVPPFPFTDNMEGTTYEVRIMQASRDVLRHLYNGSTHTTDYVYRWTLEETN
jgi:hypothetical protein